MQFGVISTSKFFKDDKIARVRRESAICNQLKIYKNLIYLICTGIITRFRVQFGVISTSKFFKDDKIARVRRESAICNQLKIYKNLIYLICIGK